MYSVGYNRLFYTSKTAVGKTVEIDILNPKLVRSERMTMIPVDDLFYIDVYFSQRGSFVLRVFENDIIKHSDILVVGDDNLIVYPNENLI